MKCSALRTSVTASLIAGLALGCAQLPAADFLESSTRVANADRCKGMNALSDAEVSLRLDIAAVMLEKLRAYTAKTNDQICAMTEPEVSKVLLVDRNKYRNPDRKTFRAPAKEFIRQWDADDQGKLPTSSQMLAADAARKAMAAGNRGGSGVGESVIKEGAGTGSSQWTAIGPGNVGGRVRAIAIDPRNANRLFIGAASGGIWITEDAGKSFRAVLDFMGNLAIGALAIDPVNPNVIYAATGESFAGLPGIGIFKSTDDGATWALLPGTNTDTAVNSGGNDWVYINRIAISPANPNIVLAGTYTSLFRSINGGASWTKVGNFETLDVRFDPNDASRALTGTDQGFLYYSRDAGLTWTASAVLVAPGSLKGRGTPKTARAEIAYARSQPNLAYISLDNNADDATARGEVWKSVDGGATWNLLSTPRHLNEQGDYDNTIWVDPTNENHLVVGGLDLYQSTDGGAGFNRISTWQQAGPGLPQPHSDHHQIVSVPNFSAANPIVYFGNDGGLYRANNIFNVSSSFNASWENLNNGLAVTQFYGGAGKRAAGGKIIGGTQDNGTLVYSAGTSWDRFAGGDGGFVAVDPVDDSTLYGEYVYAAIRRTLDLSSGAYICKGITDALKNTTGSTYCGADNIEAANFIAPFILDPNNRNRMLVGANSLWISNNLKDSIPAWAAIKSPVVPVASADKPYISAVAVADKDSNIIWTGHSASGSTVGQVWKSINGLSGAPTWQRVGAGVLPTSTVNRITIDPDNPNRVWVSYSGFALARIWATSDGGATWANIHNNLPSITVHDLKRHPLQANWLYAATANGVYTSENAGQTWSTSNDGPASVRVRELFWYDPSTLVAATYGRGMFRTAIAGGGPAITSNYQGLWWNANQSGWGMSITQHRDIIFAAMYTYDDAGLPVWYVIAACPVASGRCTGDIYRVTGGTSPAAPWNGAGKIVTKVGAGTLAFTNTSTGTFNYTINNISGSKAITLQPLASGTTAPAVDYTDLWWNPDESGWGVSLTQQFATVFAAWYTYDSTGKPIWYVANCPLAGATGTGDLYQVTGGAPLTSVWNGTNLATRVGSVTFAFSNASNGTMTYTLNGATSSRVISRQPF